MDKQHMIDRIRKYAQEDTDKDNARIELINALPDTLQNVHFVHAGGYRVDGSVVFEVQTLDDVSSIIAQLPAVDNGVKVKSWYTTFTTGDKLTDKEREEANTLPIAPYTVKIQQIAEYPVWAQVEWFTMLGDKLVNVEVKIKNASTWAKITPHHERGYRNRIVRHAWIHSIDGFAKYEKTAFASGQHDKPGECVFYWVGRGLKWNDIRQ